MDGQVCLEKGKGFLVTDRREVQAIRSGISGVFGVQILYTCTTLGERRAWVGKVLVRKKIECKYSRQTTERVR